MTIKEWKRQLGANLSSLPRRERKRILAYYDEMYADKADAGLAEAEIVREFGDPATAAARIRAEEGAKPPKKAHPLLGSFLMILAAIPAAAVLVCLAAAALALFVSGFAVLLGGIAYLLYFLVQLCMYGGAGYAAHIGIGLAAAGVGALLIPLFLHCTKWLLSVCGKIFVWTGRLFRGRKEAY